MIAGFISNLKDFVINWTELFPDKTMNADKKENADSPCESDNIYQR